MACLQRLAGLARSLSSALSRPMRAPAPSSGSTHRRSAASAVAVVDSEYEATNREDIRNRPSASPLPAGWCPGGGERASALAAGSRSVGGGRGGWMAMGRQDVQMRAQTAGPLKLLGVPYLGTGTVVSKNSKVQQWHSSCINFRRHFSVNMSAAVPLPAIAPPPQKEPISRASEWAYLPIEDSPLEIAQKPGWRLPDFARLVKTLCGVIPEYCIDESLYLINYDPLEFLQKNQILRKELIFGSENQSGEILYTWIPRDSGLNLLRSLPELAEFFHQQGVCLPRLALHDLVITGAGKFRLRSKSISFRPFTATNVRDVYRNISTLTMDVLVVSHGQGIITEMNLDFYDLIDVLQGWNNCTVDEYRIRTHSFYIPLGNKAQGLVRAIDFIFSEFGNMEVVRFREEILYCEDQEDWKSITEGNAYLKQWFSFRVYGKAVRDFLQFMRNVHIHKREHGQADLFVDFLLYASYPGLLHCLQEKFTHIGMLKKLRLEELLTSKQPAVSSCTGLSLREEDLGDEDFLDIDEDLLLRAKSYGH